jgi:hypothetical protein
MTTLETKMQILHDLYMEYANEYPDFVETHDVGVPLAALTVLGHALPTPKGVAQIEATYDNWCEFLEIDRHGDYTSFEDMIEMSVMDYE